MPYSNWKLLYVSLIQYLIRQSRLQSTLSIVASSMLPIWQDVEMFKKQYIPFRKVHVQVKLINVVINYHTSHVHVILMNWLCIHSVLFSVAVGHISALLYRIKLQTVDPNCHDDKYLLVCNCHIVLIRTCGIKSNLWLLHLHICVVAGFLIWVDLGIAWVSTHRIKPVFLW